MRAWRFFLFTVFFFGVWGFAEARVVDRVMAVVNDDVVTLYDLDRAMAPHLAEIRRAANPEARRREITRQVLDNLINQQLLRQEVAKAKIEVSTEELSRAIADVLQQNRITIDALQNELAAKGVSFEAFKEQLQDEIRQAKFIRENLGSLVQVTRQDIENYRVHRKGAVESGEEARVRWIVFPLKKAGKDKTVKRLVQKGQKAALRARKGEDFEKLIRRYSKKKSGAGQSASTWKSLSALPDAVASWVRGAVAGTVSDPLVAPEGVYIVHLVEKSDAGGALVGVLPEDSRVEQALYQERMGQEMHNYLMRLRKKAFIEMRE